MCELCNRHFCGQHLVSALHTCPTEKDIHSIYASGDPAQFKYLSTIRRTAGEAMISALLQTINCDALRIRAEALRNGIRCTISLPSAKEAYFNFDILGGCNYHASILFEDGKNWLARFRLPNHNAPPLQERNFDRRSEFATYRFLAGTSVPVSQVYDFADDEDPVNLVGAGYILLEKLSGKPMTWYNATEVQKQWFSRQLADIYIVLERHPFGEMGRLQPALSTRQPEVGPAFFDYDENGAFLPFGPFEHSSEYYAALIERRIKLIISGETSTSAPVDAYLVYKTLLDHLPQQEESGPPFFLRHLDSRDANFLIDDDYNITGIIDWELAVLAPKSSAFQSPLLMYNLGEFYQEGLSTPSKDERRFARILREEKGRDDLARLTAQKMIFRFEQCIETDPHEWETFLQLFTGWWKAVTKIPAFDWDSWRMEALESFAQGGGKAVTKIPAFDWDSWRMEALERYGDGGLSGH
ncbi:MAG: hypothetical protein M1830_008587 [Pleopsidium flavum]|nr:MAG: hypothetical protein M1830_008587 [Pleopsidium flavum]